MLLSSIPQLIAQNECGVQVENYGIYAGKQLRDKTLEVSSGVVPPLPPSGRPMRRVGHSRYAPSIGCALNAQVKFWRLEMSLQRKFILMGTMMSVVLAVACVAD